MSEAFIKILDRAIAESAKYQSCMSLHVQEDGQRVTLLLDTSLDTYHEWIPGEGADIGLIRDRETKKTVGIDLPLLNHRLCVHHDGPIRINAGFRKEETS